VADGTLTIISQVTGTAFECYLGDGPALVTEGYGGWKVTNRPREIGVVDWEGRVPMAIDIPFMIYFFEDLISNSPGVLCESQVSRLELLCGIGGHARPPVCVVDGGGLVPHDNTIAPGHHLWVIENVTWDRAMELRSASSARRLKCGGTITIRQYLVAESIVQRLNPQSRTVTPKTYTVKAGDTLSKIAAFMYRDSNKWKLIADANTKILTDPRAKMKAGTRLKIPQY
jgi:hypothetical protein